MITFSLTIFVVLCLVFGAILALFTFIGYAYGRATEVTEREMDKIYSYVKQEDRNRGKL